MNANVYEYGTCPENGLSRRLVRNSAMVEEEMDSNPKPSAIVHLRMQTYVEVAGVVTIVTDVVAGYKVTKGEISVDVTGAALPKRTIASDGTATAELDVDGNAIPRDNGYDNIIYLSQIGVPFDTVLDNGIKEYYNIA